MNSFDATLQSGLCLNRHSPLPPELVAIVLQYLAYLKVTDAIIRGLVEQWCNNSFTEEDLQHFGPISAWDVSEVTDMAYLFVAEDEYHFYFGGPYPSPCQTFNGNISEWNVGKVKDMSTMFQDAYAFNQPLDNWDVGNVELMSQMFSGAKAFNQPLDNWDVGNVKFMDEMFMDATAFNQDLRIRNIREGVSMTNMFDGAATSPDWSKH